MINRWVRFDKMVSVDPQGWFVNLQYSLWNSIFSNMGEDFLYFLFCQSCDSRAICSWLYWHSEAKHTGDCMQWERSVREVEPRAEWERTRLIDWVSTSTHMQCVKLCIYCSVHKYFYLIMVLNCLLFCTLQVNCSESKQRKLLINGMDKL